MNKSITASLQYRMTVPKSDKKNMCHDISRSDGFYWFDVPTAQTQNIVDNLNLSPTMTVDEIAAKMKDVEIINGAEAAKLEVHIYFEGGCNGRHRLNADIEWFKDLRDLNNYKMVPHGVVIGME